ncbi:MAG: glycosyltransferase [Candidatus Anstonellales archaeon]
MKKLTVIIPTLNEEKNIKPLIKEILSIYPNTNIMVADDGSTDNTKNEVLSFRSKNITFLDRSKKKIHGLTASVIDAILHTKTPYFIVMDADFQHPPSTIPDIAFCLESGADLTIAYRVGKRNSLSFPRRAISTIAHQIASLRLTLAGKPTVPDLTSGFFGMQTTLARSIILRSKFQLEGYKVLFEFIKYAPKGTEIGLVPYKRFLKRASGRSKFGPRHILYFLRSLI